jgi:hypothetical protein
VPALAEGGEGRLQVADGGIRQFLGAGVLVVRVRAPPAVGGVLALDPLVALVDVVEDPVEREGVEDVVQGEVVVAGEDLDQRPPLLLVQAAAGLLV